MIFRRYNTIINRIQNLIDEIEIHNYLYYQIKIIDLFE